jgi:hypothetical protein
MREASPNASRRNNSGQKRQKKKLGKEKEAL